MKRTLSIHTLGSQGHGVAQLDGKTVYVPYTLAGDEVEVKVKHSRKGTEVKLVQVLIPGAARQTPPCPYFGSCGGCTLQHLEATTYADFKQNHVRDTLAKRGFKNIPLQPTINTPAQSRRRIRLALRQTAGSLVMGFQAFRSHHIIDINSCAVTHPDLTKLLQPLRKALRPLLPQGQQVDVQLTLSDTGIDMLVDGDWQLDLHMRESLAELAHTLDLARLVVRNGSFDDPVAIRRTPTVELGGIHVPLPIGAFLQASRESTQALSQLVEDALAGVNVKVIDLFSGLGTFSLPLLQSHTVHAVESGADALAAQQAAAHGLPLSTEVRDLFFAPLMPDELAQYAAVVLDPPRAGAQAQAEQLAASQVPVIVYVSCSPSTFARDARVLVDAGYILEKLTPVDQFLWSAHTEVVGIFKR